MARWAGYSRSDEDYMFAKFTTPKPSSMDDTKLLRDIEATLANFQRSFVPPAPSPSTAGTVPVAVSVDTKGLEQKMDVLTTAVIDTFVKMNEINKKLSEAADMKEAAREEQEEEEEETQVTPAEIDFDKLGSDLIKQQNQTQEEFMRALLRQQEEFKAQQDKQQQESEDRLSKVETTWTASVNVKLEELTRQRVGLDATLQQKYEEAQTTLQAVTDALKNVKALEQTVQNVDTSVTQERLNLTLKVTQAINSMAVREKTMNAEVKKLADDIQSIKETVASFLNNEVQQTLKMIREEAVEGLRAQMKQVQKETSETIASLTVQEIAKSEQEAADVLKQAAEEVKTTDAEFKQAVAEVGATKDAIYSAGTALVQIDQDVKATAVRIETTNDTIQATASQIDTANGTIQAVASQMNTANATIQTNAAALTEAVVVANQTGQRMYDVLIGDVRPAVEELKTATGAVQEAAQTVGTTGVRLERKVDEELQAFKDVVKTEMTKVKQLQAEAGGMETGQSFETSSLSVYERVAKEQDKKQDVKGATAMSSTARSEELDPDV